MEEPRQSIPNLHASPLSDLCIKLSKLHLQSPEVEDNGNEEEYFTPPSTPPAIFYEISPFYIFGCVFVISYFRHN